MMFQTVGHRPRTQQRVRLGATPDGKLVALQHDYVYHRSILDAHHEDCGETTPFQYSVPMLIVTINVVFPPGLLSPNAATYCSSRKREKTPLTHNVTCLLAVTGRVFSLPSL